MSLSQQEVESFTGTDNLKKQKAWFRKNNIPVLLKTNGEIAITWAVINHVMCSSVDATNEPNFKAMDNF